MKHPHSELIKLWADGAQIEFLQKSTNTWVDCVDNDPIWDSATQYRVKPNPLDPWQQELVNAVKTGQQVEYSSGFGWEPANLLRSRVRQDNIADYYWYERDCYRIKPKLQAWQQKLVDCIKAGKHVEYRDNNGWHLATSLEHNVKYNCLDTYQWRAESDYRLYNDQAYTRAYKTATGWYLSAKIMTGENAQDYFKNKKVLDFKRLEQFP